MDSFELNPNNINPRRHNDSVNPSSLRQSETAGERRSRPKVRVDYGDPYSPSLFDRNEPLDPQQHVDEPVAEPAAEPAAESPEPIVQPEHQPEPEPRLEPASGQDSTIQPQQPRREDPSEKHQNIATIARFFADGRLRIFIGVLLILIAGFMLIASISFISTHSADQSIITNRTASEIAAGPHDVENSAGWFGAFMSNLLMYKWLGLGGFVIIFYIGALGISLVRLHHFRFLQLTFKSLVAAIAVSIIAGFVTFSSTSESLWGGQHGYWINSGIIDAASFWGGLAVTLLMLTALILIFIHPIKSGLRHLKMLIDNRKRALAERYKSSIAAAKAAVSAENDSSSAPAEQPDEEDATIRPLEPQTEDNNVQTGSTPDADQQSERHDTPRPISVSVITPDDEQPTATASNSEPQQPASASQQTATASFTLTDPIASTAHVESPRLETINDQPKAEATETEDIQSSEPERGKAVFSLTDISESSSSEHNSATLNDRFDSSVSSGSSHTDPQESSSASSRPAIEVDQAPRIEPKTVEEVLNSPPYDPKADLSHFKFPTIELLHDRHSNYVLTEEEQEENNNRIISTLDAYGIKIDRIKATVGPTITLYEIVPQAGTRISSIKRLGDDMALSLSAIGIRIIAPIPGKGTIGMEVPNKKPQIIGIRSILNSRAFTESKASLPIALGTTIDNQVYVADLAKMPHLLVAGATGMGKSVGLNTIIASLLYKMHPAELKFVLVDPKMVEFSLYKCLERHYLAKLPIEEEPIITDPQKVVATLNSLCLEMDNRYALLSKAGMRGIKEYNEKFISRHLNPEKGHRYLPYIVVIIDEFGDLILTAGKEVENPISRIAAKARAVGIHMILATQRPSVDVITGVIKANFPARMAFRVTQRNDSSIILDRPGAEQLIGRGDMLISRDGVIDRVQCAFIDTDEVEAICNEIAAQTGYPMAYELPEEPAPQSDGTAAGGASGKLDEMFADAGRAVIEAGMGSASLLQRKFNIGYPRAGKLIDQLANAGVVGASTGAGKPRPILMSLYDFERMLNNEL